jgi:hypothetical protein
VQQLPELLIKISNPFVKITATTTAAVSMVTSFWEISFMRRVLYRFSLFLSTLSVVALSGCATTRSAVYQDEDFSSANTYTHTFPGSAQATCEASRRALLSQGYIITAAKAELVEGNKNFQPEGDVHIQIKFNVVCAPDGKGSNSTTVFVNALQDRYSLKKSSNSASLGVGVLGSVSLPFGASDDSLVKVASETISKAKFYNRFFTLVESYLDASVIPEEEAHRKELLQAPSANNKADPAL